MGKIAKLFLLFLCILLLNGCGEWDDLVDSVTGSGDDKPTPAKEAVAAKPEVATTPEVAEEPKVTRYETEFHHTTTGSSDGGKSLVLCPGQSMNFDSCSVGDVNIPRHGNDKGRESYWNMTEVPRGDIVCVKNGKSYKYKANKTITNGKCS